MKDSQLRENTNIFSDQVLLYNHPYPYSLSQDTPITLTPHVSDPQIPPIQSPLSLFSFPRHSNLFNCSCLQSPQFPLYNPPYLYTLPPDTMTECQKMLHHHTIEGNGGYKVECTEEGHFTPRQCDQDTESCWCVEKQTGESPGYSFIFCFL